MDDILALICQLYETSTLHCFCCDPKYAILWSNRSGETFEQKEKLTELFHENELRELCQRLAEGKSCELTRKEFLKTNSVYHFTPFLKDNALVLILVTLEDTAQNRKNDQSIYDFCSSISAEYRTALFGVFNLLSVLAQDFEARELYGQLEMVNSIAYHCYKILRATLNTSAFYLLKSSDAPLNLKPVNLNLYLENLCSSIRMRLQNTEIQFRYELDPEPVNSMIDSEKFDLLIFNLLSNSCIYTNPGNEIKLTMKKNGDSYIITVSDKGVGIPNEHLRQIFEGFYSYDINKDGTSGIGIGLYLVDAIAKAHGGSCVINSSLNEGTTVSLRFPIKDTRSAFPEMRSPLPDYLSNKFSPLYIFLGEISGYHVF